MENCHNVCDRNPSGAAGDAIIFRCNLALEKPALTSVQMTPRQFCAMMDAVGMPVWSVRDGFSQLCFGKLSRRCIVPSTECFKGKRGKSERSKPFNLTVLCEC